MNEFIFKSYGNSKQSISYCEVDKCKAVVELKQQLDQLKANNDALFKAIEEVNKINKKLEAENERLKKEIRLYDCIDKWGTEQCHCACRCLGNEFCDAAEEKMKNIKQTLAEINRMAENTYCLTNTTNKDMANFSKQIFQKISEVEK